jgi:hypothetical protein
LPAAETGALIKNRGHQSRKTGVVIRPMHESAEINTASLANEKVGRIEPKPVTGQQIRFPDRDLKITGGIGNGVSVVLTAKSALAGARLSILRRLGRFVENRDIAAMAAAFKFMHENDPK